MKIIRVVIPKTVVEKTQLDGLQNCLRVASVRLRPIRPVEDLLAEVVVEFRLRLDDEVGHAFDEKRSSLRIENLRAAGDLAIDMGIGGAKFEHLAAP